MGTFRYGNVLVREHSGMGTFWYGNIQVWERSGTSRTFRYGNVQVQECSGMGTFRYGNVLVREHSGTGTFWYGNVRVRERSCMGTFMYGNVHVWERVCSPHSHCCGSSISAQMLKLKSSTFHIVFSKKKVLTSSIKYIFFLILCGLLGWYLFSHKYKEIEGKIYINRNIYRSYIGY